MQSASYEILIGKCSFPRALKKYDTPKSTIIRFIKPILNALKLSKPKECVQRIKMKILSKKKLEDLVNCTKQKKLGRNTSLTPDEEAVYVACCDMKAVRGLPSDRSNLSEKLEECKSDGRRE